MEKTKQCYTCEKHITQKQVEDGRKLIEFVETTMDETFTEKLTEKYWLIRCVGPDEMFHDDGGVIQCVKCISEVLKDLHDEHLENE